MQLFDISVLDLSWDRIQGQHYLKQQQIQFLTTLWIMTWEELTHLMFYSISYMSTIFQD